MSTEKAMHGDHDIMLDDDLRREQEARLERVNQDKNIALTRIRTRGLHRWNPNAEAELEQDHRETIASVKEIIRQKALARLQQSA